MPLVFSFVSFAVKLLRGAGTEGDVGGFVEDGGAGRERTDNPDVATDDGAFANDGVAAEDGGTCVNYHIVFNVRMSLVTLD